MQTKYIPTEVKVEEHLSAPDYDGIVLVSGIPPGTGEPDVFKSVLLFNAEIDKALFETGAVLLIALPAARLIYSPTGPIDPDYSDVRVYAEAATKGIKRALKAGVRMPLLAIIPDAKFEATELVTLLGALAALYVPLQVREIGPDRTHKAKKLGVWSTIGLEKLQTIVNQALVLESGRYVARDIGGSDPERMAPPRVEQYIRDLFAGTRIKIDVTSDVNSLEKEYPLLAAVNRGASVIPRHAGRVIFLTYEPQDPSAVTETLILVGKGVTVDTGGNDIKTGGHMVGMSRDKCGAGGCVGFMQTVNLLQPSNFKVIVAVGVVRNSCGENAYVSDEVITARSGARVRVSNTDAEGRMVMADILCHVKEMAMNLVNPRIFTVATLTGHAQLVAGTGFSIAIDNSVAKEASNAYKIQACGEKLGDMLEVSILRKEDFVMHKGKHEGDDVLQAGPKSSMYLERGHQGPAAFLIMASGLDKHGKGSKKPLHYCHLDICGSEVTFPDPVLGVPVLSLSERFLYK